MSDLKKCAHCDWPVARERGGDDPRGGDYSYSCVSCGCGTGECFSRKIARDKWNRRVNREAEGKPSQ